MIKKVFNLPPHLPSKNEHFHKNLIFDPLSWEYCFDEKKIINIGNNKFNLYFKGSSGPVLFFIHGGGFSGLSWGFLAKELHNLIECRCVAIDLRGHGDTQTIDDLDISIQTLTSDVLEIVQHLFHEDVANLLLVGHSMGGGIAVNLARDAVEHKLSYIKGIILIDVVEGTALESLSAMPSYLRSRPKYFDTIAKAIEWSIKSGQIKNVDSARFSVPGELKRMDNPGPEYFNNQCRWNPLKDQRHFVSIPEDALLENPNDVLTLKDDTPSNDSQLSNPTVSNHPIYVWRADLEKTEKYWEGWFKGISKMFIDLPLDKMIILAGVDHLDKELTIAQMQGKFQMVILGKCGHSVHEDLPDQVAQVIASFLAKHKLAIFNNPNANLFQPSC